MVENDGSKGITSNPNVAMSYKQERYSKQDDFDEFESIGERLAADLRRNIRQLVRNNMSSLGVILKLLGVG